MKRLFLLCAILFAFHHQVFAKKKGCYAVYRDGNVMDIPRMDHSACISEMRKAKSNLLSDKSIVSVGWGDSSKVDAKAISDDQMPNVEKGPTAPLACLSEVQAVPNIIPGTDGKIDGLRLMTVKSGSNWEKVGLKPMDVIVSVNGQTVQNPTTINTLFKAGANALAARRSDGTMGFVTLECQ